MFGARKGADGEIIQDPSNRSETVATNPPRAPETSLSSPRLPVAERVHAPQRVVDIPRAARRAHSITDSTADSRLPGDGSRTLRVGKGLSVAGEITSCDILIVEGKVEAKLNDGKMLEITEAGQFRGSVEIENADIAGRYDGQLVVHGRLTVRSTGRISGMVKYGEIEINAGGQIIGEIQVTGGGAATTAATPGFKGTKYSAYAEETEDQTTPQPTSRRSA